MTLAVTDSELIHNYFNGQQKSIDILLNRYREKIYSFIFSKVKNYETTNDIYQEVCIKIIQNLTVSKYKDQQRFSSWAMRIAYNAIMDHYRHQKRLPKYENMEGYKQYSSLEDRSNAEQSMIYKEMVCEIKKMLDTLPKEQKEVIQLRFYQKLSFKEISEKTGVSINTALGRMRYGIMNLRKKIPNQNNNHLLFQS